MSKTRKRDPRYGYEVYARVPLWWAVQAAEATHTKEAVIWVLLLRLHWENGRRPFKLPSKRLEGWGISRQTKLRALRKLEAAGLIEVEWRECKSPIVTLRYV